MRLSAAHAVIETLAVKLDCSFADAIKYIRSNYKSCNKYQKLAYDFFAEPTGDGPMPTAIRESM
jgi:hypothetical protein